MRLSVRAAAALVALLASAAPVAGAQPVLLEIRPHVGDTLRMRMDQLVEMTGTTQACAGSLAVPRNRLSGACADSMRVMTTRTEVFTRAITRRAARDATYMLAITDSVRAAVSSTGEQPRPTRISTPVQNVELRVAGDGAIEVVDGGRISDDLRSLFGQMPATLSRKAVAVGERWTREMRVPLATEPGGQGLVRATFQLDSLGPNGDVAFISMKGALTHDHRVRGSADASGSITAAIQLNRRLGWITDTRTTIDAFSVVRSGNSERLMHVRTRITQWLRAVSGR